ncbi:M48 family peptidase [Citrobacter amalonaticus]|nr:M48 family peptidase [Citrobacter amalonaticus]
MSQLTYLQGYPENLLSQVRTLIAEKRLGAVLEKRYPGTHDFATDKALWQYTQDLKSQFLRNAPPINKVMYDNKIHVLKNALGLHTAVSRIQGGKLKAKAEIRVATVFRNAPEPFFAHDRRPRTGTSEGKGTQQGVLSALLSHGTALSPAGI